MSSMSHNDLQQIRQRLSHARGPQYWRSLEELAESEAFGRFLHQEFPRLGAVWEAPLDRRGALKLMAASLALAGLTACGRQPPEFIVPYVNMPEGQVPGVLRDYATSHLVGGYAHGVLARSHQGRPVKLEGNPQHPATLGACDIFSQASVLSLYDPDRAAAVMHRGNIAGYDDWLMALWERRRTWEAREGRGLAILTGSLTSPSQHDRLSTLLARWPQARWYVHEPIDRRAVYAGSELLFGRPLEAVYHFERTRVVVSLDADFLQMQPGFLRYAHDLMTRRRPRDNDDVLTRLYVVESTPSITGSVADHRHRLDYRQVEAFARQLARALGVAVEPPDRPGVAESWLNPLVDDLRRHAGEAVVVPGDRQPPAVHAIAHAINQQLEAHGRTLAFITPVDAGHAAPGLDALTEAMQAGEVDDLVVMGTNPVYTAPADLAFERAYRQVPWRLHWGETYNETGRLSHWHIPATHALETWGDARAFDGTTSFLQPLIQPLHGGKTGLQLLTALTRGIDEDARELLVGYWRERHDEEDFTTFWRRCLHDGLLAGSTSLAVEVTPREGWMNALPPPPSAKEPAEGITLQLQPDAAVWDGHYANNGWLQELPRPLTKLTWSNALLVSPALAEARGLMEGEVVRISTRDHRLEVPVYVLPGMPERAVTLSLGYGRKGIGQVADGVGHNAYRLQASRQRWAIPVELEKTGDHENLAVTQHHHAIEGRDLIRATTLEAYRDNPAFAKHPPPQESLYPEPWPADRQAEHAWGMVVDLSACIGCNACVMGCQAENNIPVVGPEEVRRGREMHWIRIDRYFEGPLESPRLIFQPVLCMHCENAPCEYVCPVGATQHSASGLNEMIYNRCIGTRYCSQNCPYKVRRFNWFDYTGRQATYPQPDAVHNPEVTIRSRGVMEKCTFCVQRINRARITADVTDQPIRDGELQTACQQACPTQAIVFGDISDSQSQVRKLKEHPLAYGMLEHLNTRPRVSYLAGVGNPNREIETPQDVSRVNPDRTQSQTRGGPGSDEPVVRHFDPEVASGGKEGAA
ncbi:TAT-variant-translocated molybdopterin oxidoreductase [Halomonas cerina]|uniref:Molybdopterin-containing oxidoreductase family iron-sulfur binding subunit n=1 Tax=Halomonas cerina TaxID=447424 RepID=A0A839V796_9GAMM|nr:TAT-variant-translocated molybdopterin oxidoreductase [Halomonas cerina]MBB3189665.1 molybdopterin-containing oxidoreductase family iron-sulfur binding subunit [Halomonas cerina]